jgi:hypothetical protein
MLAREQPQPADPRLATARATQKHREHMFIPDGAMAMFIDTAVDELY